MQENVGQRYVSKFCIKLGKMTKKSKDILQQAYYGDNLKVCPYLYANANEACKIEANLNECQKVVYLAFANLNVCPALRTYFSLKYRLQLDIVWLFTEHSRNIRHTNECCSQSLGYMSASTFLLFPHASFSIRLQIWMRLYEYANVLPLI